MCDRKHNYCDIIQNVEHRLGIHHVMISWNLKESGVGVDLFWRRGNSVFEQWDNHKMFTVFSEFCKPQYLVKFSCWEKRNREVSKNSDSKRDTLPFVIRKVKFTCPNRNSKSHLLIFWVFWDILVTSSYSKRYFNPYTNSEIMSSFCHLSGNCFHPAPDFSGTARNRLACASTLLFCAWQVC